VDAESATRLEAPAYQRSGDELLRASRVDPRRGLSEAPIMGEVGLGDRDSQRRRTT
jgi:hypothetical protein